MFYSKKSTNLLQNHRIINTIPPHSGAGYFIQKEEKAMVGILERERIEAKDQEEGVGNGS